MHYILQTSENWLLDQMKILAQDYGYFGIFFISLIGSVSVVFPVPYTIVIYLMGAVLNPVFIAISSGLGSALGEFSGYVLGYYGRAVISEERRRKMEYMVKLFDRYGPAAIFFFALTPLPDDLLFIPLGVMHYPFWKIFIPALIGKTFMSFILAYAGQQSIEFIEVVFGGSGLLGAVITIALLVVIIVAIVKIDWEKLFEKRVGSKS